MYFSKHLLPSGSSTANTILLINFQKITTVQNILQLAKPFANYSSVTFLQINTHHNFIMFFGLAFFRMNMFSQDIKLSIIWRRLLSRYVSYCSHALTIPPGCVPSLTGASYLLDAYRCPLPSSCYTYDWGWREKRHDLSIMVFP